MPARTRAEMHILLDVELEILQSSQFNTLDPAAKDLLLQGAVDDFIKETIDNANPPNPTKRIPGGVVTYQDTLAKYNAIHTLIEESELVSRVAGSLVPVFNVTVSHIGTSSDWYITVNCVPNVHNLQSGDKIVITGLKVDDVIYNGTYSVGTILSTYQFKIESIGVFTSLAVIDTIGTYAYTYSGKYIQYLLPTNIFHLECSYAEVSLTGCTTTKVVPNFLPSLYDITTLKLDPYIKKTGCLISSVQNNYLKIETYNDLYTIHNAYLVYIKNPAKISDIANCDLPPSIHDEIVKRAAKSITAFNNNPSYQAIASEIKTTE